MSSDMANGAPPGRAHPHTIRQDVQSMHAYAIQPSAGLVKLDAMENPFRLPPELQRELGERLGARGDQPLPGAGTGDVVAALSRFVELPAGCKLMLGNGSDELIDMLSVACDVPGATRAGAAARLRDVRDVGAAARPELRRRAADGGLRARRGGDAGGHRAAPPGADLHRLPEQPDGQPVRRAASSTASSPPSARSSGLVVFDEAYQPFSSRTWMQRMARARARAGDAHAVASSAWPACAWATCAGRRR